MAKKKTKNPFITILNIVLVLVTAVGALCCFLYLYYNTFGKDKLPNALTTTYVNTVTDPQTNEQKPFIQVNVRSAEVGTGKNLVEVLFNSYTGTDKQAIIGMGFQLIDGEVYYYNKVGDTGFIPVVDEDLQFDQQEDMFLTDVDGQLFAIKIDGTYKRQLNGVVYAISNAVLNLFGQGAITVNETYTLEEFLRAIETTVISNSNGAGEGTLALVEMSSYLSFYDAETNQQISNEELGKYGITNSYFTIQYTYSRSGVLFAEQSMFGSVAGDGEYNASGVDSNKDYWQAITDVVLDENDFETRVSAANGKVYLYLTADAINKLNLNTAVEVYLNINLDNVVDAVGFDYYALSGLKNIKTITITSSTQKDFEMLDDALRGTGIEVEDILTTNVNLIDNSVVEEVA